MKLETRIQGIEDIAKVFNELPRSMQRRAYYRALMSGAGVVRDAAVRNLKAMPMNESTGSLAKNIRVYRKKRRRGLYGVAVRVRRGALNRRKKDGDGNPVRIGLYGSVLEYGKKNQPPRSWIRKAIREERSQAIDKLSSGMRKHMLESLDDAKKRSGAKR